MLYRIPKELSIDLSGSSVSLKSLDFSPKKIYVELMQKIELAGGDHEYEGH